jgi:hypothetical protein
MGILRVGCKYILSDKRKIAVCLPFGLMFALFLTVGADIAANGRLTISAGWPLVTVPLTILFAAVLFVLITFAPKLTDKLGGSRFEKFLTGLQVDNSRLFAFTFLFIFSAWIPCFLAFYPGMFAYDAPTHIRDVVFDMMSTHHPIIHTWWLAGCVGIGNLVLGSYNAGLAVYTVVNMAVLASCGAYCLVFLRRLKLPFTFLFLGAAYLAFTPSIALLAISTTKDIIFSALCVYLFLFTVDMLLDTDGFFSSRSRQARFVLMAVTMALFKNNGIYAFLFCVPFIVYAVKAHRLRLTALCLSAAVIYAVTAQVFVIIADADSVSPAEALSLPIQQISRVYAEKGGELDEQTLHDIEALIPAVIRYNPANGQHVRISDFMKITFKDEIFTANRPHYLSLWFDLGLKYPGAYVSAFLFQTQMLWYVDQNYRAPIAHLEVIFKEVENNLYPEPFFKQWQAPYLAFADKDMHINHLWLQVLFSPASTTWLMLFAAATCIYNKRRELLTPSAFLFGLWLTVALAPLVHIRYMLMFFMLMPFFLGMVFYRNNRVNIT